MRLIGLLAITLTVSLLPQLASTQDLTMRALLTEAERAFPSAQAPALFGPDSMASDYAAEPEDKLWSSAMEARILEEIESVKDRGLIVRRTDVECRSSTCAVILVHAAGRDRSVSVATLTGALRDNLGFTGVSTAGREIPVQFIDNSLPEEPTVRTVFVAGFAEIVLRGAAGAEALARENSGSP